MYSRKPSKLLAPHLPAVRESFNLPFSHPKPPIALSIASFSLSRSRKWVRKFHCHHVQCQVHAHRLQMQGKGYAAAAAQ